MRRARVLSIASLASWPLAVWWLGAQAGHHAEAWGAALGHWDRSVEQGSALGAEPLPEGSFVVEDLSALSDAAPEPAPKKLGSQAARKPTAAQKPRPKHGIRVPAATVLRLANAGAVPQGKFSKAKGEHPAGLQLAGVSHFGVGLRDGDVLTEVAGHPATSRAVVVSAVLQARAARAPAISAVFWREGQPWQLLVEMPYLRGS